MRLRQSRRLLRWSIGLGVLGVAFLSQPAPATAACPLQFNPAKINGSPGVGRLPNGMVGQFYTVTITVSGGEGAPYDWGYSTLLPGVTSFVEDANAGTVTISGTPTGAGHFRISIHASSVGGSCPEGATYDIEVGPPDITFVGPSYAACENKIIVYGDKLNGYMSDPGQLYINGVQATYTASVAFTGQDVFEVTPLPSGLPVGTPIPIRVVTDGGATGEDTYQYTVHGYPPYSSTGSSSVVGDDVTLNGTTNPGCLATSTRFQYGRVQPDNTWSYTHATPDESAGSALGDTAVSDTINDLVPGTYHYRLSATNAEGTEYGTDQQFTIAGVTSFAGTVRNVEDTGIPDVEVQLSGAASSTTTTDAQGDYSFTGLQPGSYSVTPLTDPPPGHLPGGRWVVTHCTAAGIGPNPLGTITPPPCSLGLVADVPGTGDFEYRGDPGVLISAGPDGPVGSSTVEFDFAAPQAGDGAYECSLDGAGYAGCTAPKRYEGLAEGSHAFRVRFSPQGESPGPVTERSFSVDTTPPKATITSAPEFGGNDRDAVIEFVSNEPNSTFRCALDGAAETPCSSPEKLFQLDDGDHTFAVRAVDIVGNAQPTPTTTGWSVGSSCLSTQRVARISQAPPDAGCIPPVTCPAGQTSKVTVGVALVAVSRTVEGCFKSERGGKVMVATGPIALNGIRITPDAGKRITIGTGEDDQLTVEAGMKWEFTSWLWFRTDFKFSLDLKFESGLGKLLFTKLDQQPFSMFGMKFQFSPSFSLSPEGGGSTKIGLKVTLPNVIAADQGPVKLPTVDYNPDNPLKLPVLDYQNPAPLPVVENDPSKPRPLPVVDPLKPGQLPVLQQNPKDQKEPPAYSVSAEFTLTTSNTFRPKVAGKLSLKKAYLFRVASLKGVSVAFDSGPPFAIDLNGTFKLENTKLVGDGPEVEASIGFAEDGFLGPLKKFGAKVSGLTVPIEPGVFLRRLSAGASGTRLNPDVVLVKLSGGAGISLGKPIDKIGLKVEPLSIDGTAAYTFPVGALDDRLFKLEFTGDGKIVEIPIATAKASWTSSLWEAEGVLDLTYKSYGIKEQFKGWLKTQEGDFNVYGRATINLGFQSDMETVVSHLGVAICAVDKVRWGIAKGWGQNWKSFFYGCDLGPYTAKASQAGVVDGFDIAPGTRAAGLALVGSDAAPKAVVTRPDGVRIDLLDAIRTDRAVVLPDLEERTMRAVLFDPPPGRWTVAAVPGSTITEILVAPARPPVEVSAKVSGSGLKRTLRWKLTPQAGMSVDFVEQGSEVANVLTTTSKASGSVQFRPQRVDARAREILAVVSQDGLPRQNISVARFTAPPRVKLTKARAVRRRGRTLSWRRVAGAGSYSVAVVDGRGRQRAGKTRRPRFTLPKAMAKPALRVSVVAIGVDRRLGPRSTASIRKRRR